MSRHDQIVTELCRALMQWRCPGCGGSGIYRQHNAPAVTSKVCGGSGLHPTAADAIANARGQG